MRGQVLLAAMFLTGCILNRSGTVQDRSGIDGAVVDASVALDGAGTDGRVGPPDSGPSPPDCMEGATRDVPCGACGTSTERCTGGAWLPMGDCVEMPVCMPGETETEMTACGRCGSQTRTRTCGGCDGWSAWSDTSPCTDEGECAPGDMRMTSEACACGSGAQAVTDVCSSSCAWERTTGPCSMRSCNTLLGDVCPGDRAWRTCPRSLGLRQCTCNGTTGEFGMCDDSTC